MTIADGNGSGKWGRVLRSLDIRHKWGFLFESTLPARTALIGVILLTSTGSFGLGLIAGKEGGAGKGDNGFWIEKLDPKTVVEVNGVVTGSSTAEKVKAAPAIPTPTQPAAASKATSVSTPPAAGSYVASKTGTKYYLPWCGTAKRIKAENQVWFASKTEAEAAGYAPAGNCKGI